MNPIKIRLLNDVFGDKVATFFSDRSIDFVLNSDQTDLTIVQKEYLSEQLGFPVSQIINIRQVHGDQVISATAEDLRSHRPLPEADGIFIPAATLFPAGKAIRSIISMPRRSTIISGI